MSDFMPVEHMFSVDSVGKETKKQYQGDFIYRRLNLKHQAEADKLKARLNGTNVQQLSKSTLAVHEMLSWLYYGIASAPKWWFESAFSDVESTQIRENDDSVIPGYHLYDANIVREIYDEVAKFEESFRERMFGKKEKKEKENKL